MENSNFILEIYKHKETVFRLSDIALFFPKEKSEYLSERMSYYRRTGRVISLRKGIYAKPGYNPLELANKLYRPSYLSLEYVLQKAGVIFQYDSRYTSVSYLSRKLIIEDKKYHYRRIKEDIIMDMKGIVQTGENINIAIPERAFLDMLYLDKEFYFDNINPLNQELIQQIIPVYNSIALEKRVKEIFKNDRYQ